MRQIRSQRSEIRITAAVFLISAVCSLLCLKPVQAACLVVTPGGSGNGSGSDWNNAFAGLPATLTRGDIYYLADGSYGNYAFNTPISGATMVTIRKAQTYDHCTDTGWNATAMGNAQAVFANRLQFDVVTGYLVVDGNGRQTTPGCGGAPGSTLSASPPNPADCGIKIDNSGCSSSTGDACDRPLTIEANVTNYTFQYVEIAGNGNNNSDRAEVVSPYGGNSNSTFTHIYGHNSGCVYFQYGGQSRTVSFSYFWGTAVDGAPGNLCHAQYSFYSPPDSNGVEHDNVYRDITGTAVWTFANPGTGTSDGWKFYNNVIWATTTNVPLGLLANGILSCINTGVNCTNFTLAQNTVINTHYASGINNENTGSYTVQNNLWYQTLDYYGNPGGLNFNGGTGGTYTEDYNSYLQSGTSLGYGSPVPGSNDVFDAGSPNPFVNWSGGNFNLASENADWTNRLALGSPFTTDPNGLIRTTDRGAYQYTGPSGTDIYLAQNAAGAANGADCNDAYVYTFFNNSANWTTGTPSSTLIGPGTTVHLCGTFTGAAGQTLLTFQGGGSSGNPVTLLFEPGAKLLAPYWNTAIVSNGQSKITIDGGTNGLIQNTLNGTPGGTCPGGPCTQQQPSAGVSLTSCANCTVKNVTIADLYDRTSNSDESAGASGAGCIFVQNNSNSGASNVLIQNNTVHDCTNGIFYGYGVNDGGITIESNTIYNMNWAIAVGAFSVNTAANGVSIYGNWMHDWANWNDSPSPYNFHHDGVMVYAGQTGTSVSNLQVYGNTYSGDFGSGTGMNYLDNLSGGGTISGTFFNNLVALSGTTGTTGGNAAITAQNEDGQSPVSVKAYNNTLIGVGTMYGFWLEGPNVTADLRNNIIDNWGTLFYVSGGATVPSVMDYNDWYAPVIGGNGIWDVNGAGYNTLSSWQNATGLDMHSAVGNPNLSGTYALQAGSPAIGAGANLTTLDITALDSDRAGNVRPSTGPWDVGAYQYCPPGACTQAVPPVCGDGICNGNETCSSCPSDCGTCPAPPPGGSGTTVSNLSAVQIYPNPWRADKHAAHPTVTFANLPSGSTMKIFTASGHLVRTLGGQSLRLGTMTWDLTNDSGDKVASGIYLYLITDSQGDKVKGKLAVIK
jgi:hypothetical protein